MELTLTAIAIGAFMAGSFLYESKKKKGKK
jgi:hypothetical protein